MIVGSSDSYDITELKYFFEKAFRETGLNVTRNKVLIKPNLLSGKPPERAVTTHPLFLRALGELLIDNSCTVSIGDSPGYEPLEKVLKTGGYLEMIVELGLDIAHFDNEVIKRSQGISPYREFLFGEDPARYDLVFNAPKLKTHGMMGMTLGVKNTFGFIKGFEKGRWHLRSGKDRDLFASILVDIHCVASTTITVLDGVLGMCGNGPSSGTPVNTSILAVSRNAFALDSFIEDRLCRGFYFPVSSFAKKHGLLDEYEVVDLGICDPVPFPMPRTCDTDWGLPAPVKRVLRNVFLKKPKVVKTACRLCGVCMKVCPANAIHTGKNSIGFDYSACIRCYCCQEMCPHNAIKV